MMTADEVPAAIWIVVILLAVAAILVLARIG